MYGSRARSFVSTWYQGNTWMEYSQIKNQVFCFECRHFPSPRSTTGKDNEATYTAIGFSNWKKAQYTDGGFSSHILSTDQLKAMDSWTKYKEMQASGSGSVMQMQSDVYKKQIEENRYYIKTIAEVLLVTATQNIAQRGHTETNMSDSNPGNFLKFLHLVAKHDKKNS